MFLCCVLYCFVRCCVVQRLCDGYVMCCVVSCAPVSDGAGKNFLAGVGAGVVEAVFAVTPMEVT